MRLIFRLFLDLGSALLPIRELSARGYRTKSWTTQSGTFREGRPFDKGTLYKSCVTALTSARPCTRARATRGARADRRPRDLGSSARGSDLECERRGNEARARKRAPLRGLMRARLQLGDDADAHPPAWPALSLLRLPRPSRKGHDTCPVRSIAASEVEGLVLGAGA